MQDRDNSLDEGEMCWGCPDWRDLSECAISGDGYHGASESGHAATNLERVIAPYFEYCA